MQTPTPDELRARSELLTAKLPDDGGGPNDLKLELLAEEASAAVAAITYRLIDPVTEPIVDGATFVEVPGSLVPTAKRAIALMVERYFVTGTAAFAEQVATGRRLRGFSAGPYSETYFAPGEFARRGASQGRPPMDPDDQLDQALWALSTQEARDDFVAYASGIHAPAGAINEFNYNARGNSGWPRSGFTRGPDGF